MSHDTLFDRLLSAPLVSEEVDPFSVDGELLPEEAAVVEGAVSRRVAHFTAGRVCAHRALDRLGAPPNCPVLQGEDRAPIWPEGFVGSITHTDAWCAAVVGRGTDVRSVGIDLEPSTPLKDSVLARVCTPTELRHLATLSDPDLMAKVVFCAKESVYKCQRPITGKYLGFHDVELEFEDDRFAAVFRGPAGEFEPGDRLSGRYLVERDLVAAACVLEHS